MWIVYAACSSFFAGITAVLAKCGIRKTERNQEDREKRTDFYLSVRAGDRCVVEIEMLKKTNFLSSVI